MERGTSENGIEETKEPSFCTIISPGLNTEILKIPQNFQRHILNELSDKALLKIKDSVYCAWNIRVHQIESGIYLKEGWREFLEDHSLVDGETLVFRYDGRMQFSIQIFDKNHVERVNFDYLENETHENPAFANNSANKHIELNGGEEDYQDSEEEEAATLPKSEFPSFTSIIRPRGYHVAVPVDFSRKHLPQGHYSIVLKNSKGRKWNVNVVPNSMTVQLSSGWGEFRCANRINFGDICRFELACEKKHNSGSHYSKVISMLFKSFKLIRRTSILVACIITSLIVLDWLALYLV